MLFSENSCLFPCPGVFSLAFTLAIPALRFYTKVLGPFEVIFVCSRRDGSYSILLYLEIQFSLSHLMKKLFCLCVFKNLLPMCIYLDTFVKNQFHAIALWVYFWVLYSASLVGTYSLC